MTDDDAVTRLERVLDRVRSAVLGGDLAALGALGKEAEAALDGMQAIGDRAAAARLRRKAEQNMACLSAAASGVRAARRRLEEIRCGVSGSLVTYDDQGRRLETAALRDLMQRL